MKEQSDTYPRHATNRPKKGIIVFLVLIFVLIFIFISISFWQNGTVRNVIQTFKFKDTYQAIFLSNGQVYFGKISEITNKYVILNKPFFIKVEQKQENLEEISDQPELKLISIKDEFHKPKDYMIIEKSSIILIEELDSSSQIVDIIGNY